MEDNLLFIIKYYGVLEQLEYLQSEVVELVEAISNYELACEAIDENDNHIFNLKIYKECIIGELADNFVMLNQIRRFYACPISAEKSEVFEEIDKLGGRFYFKIIKEYAKEVHKLGLAVYDAELRKQSLEDYNIFDVVDITIHLEKVFRLLESLRQLYNISQEDLDEIMSFKIQRQLGRIENENK